MHRIVRWWSIALALAACGGSSHGRIVAVGEESNGGTIVMDVGEQLTLALTSHGDGGYSNWTLASPPASGILTLTSSGHQPPPAGSGVGNFGTDLFEFQAVAAGGTSAVATAVRSWSGETLTFSVTVTVH